MSPARLGDRKERSDGWGEVTIATADGVRQTLVAGDVCFIAKGTVTTWDEPACLKEARRDRRCCTLTAASHPQGITGDGL